jgi:aminoglycoside 6'-N-acetyltransferase
LERQAVDPGAGGTFNWSGYKNVAAARRRFEEDGLIGAYGGCLAVVQEAADNLAEQRALEKVGFVREGVLRSTQFREDAWRDIVLYSLLRHEHPPGYFDLKK